ncbi:hypothetical protein V5P93_003919 [Actinokineospora auranticolor]|uniref:Uncharacterized protein n=1 Tax=Actinokineospora auranticolor TaxID=155976 RepID=A0A2S6GM30_9PSEU|nr:hypothetical protein [Actinokineospora auranticolor]PPK66201.1 hypothetical protein CLV40_111165 [Actinokineospora auranticolor]
MSDDLTNDPMFGKIIRGARAHHEREMEAMHARFGLSVETGEHVTDKPVTDKPVTDASSGTDT